MVAIFFPGWLVGALTFSALLASLLCWAPFLIPGALIKALPIPLAQEACARYMDFIASQWVATNQLILRILHAPAWHADLPPRLDPRRSYLLISNHQSWADILVLFDLMHGRAPFLRFFLKRELIWLPIIGVVCWALDMPFMKRHSKSVIAAHPELAKEDLETTRRFCERYRHRPIAAVNFIEGTRFSEAKRIAQRSPFRHLLRPKSGGLSFMLNSMGDQLGGIVDATIAYQPTSKSLAWSWLCGEQSQLAAHIDLLPIPAEMLTGDYESDREFRVRFHAWVNGIWMRKDSRLQGMLNAGHAAQSAHPV